VLFCFVITWILGVNDEKEIFIDKLCEDNMFVHAICAKGVSKEEKMKEEDNEQK